MKWDIESSLIEGELWTGTIVKYTCADEHSLEWGEIDERVCGRDGGWDIDSAPVCVPCEFT